MSPSDSHTTVLVTGVGAIIGQGIVKSLRMASGRIRIVGLDRARHPYAARICDAFYQKPECREDSSEYVSFIASLTRQESIDLVLPGIESDVFWCDENRAIFSGKTALALNDPALIAIGKDKLLTAKVLGENSFVTIPSSSSSVWEECVSRLGSPPLLVKPRFGSGSMGQVRAEDKVDFEFAIKRLKNRHLVQKIVGQDDDEYTASVFGLGKGLASVPIVFRRRLSRAGYTDAVEVVDDPAIAAMIGQLNRVFQPLGPTNYQFRREADTLYLLEVNPRISSATSLRAHFGFNESGMCIELFVQGRVPVPVPRLGKACRYVEDFFEEDGGSCSVR